MVGEAAATHEAGWFGSSARTHFWPLSRVVGALPITDMAALAKSLIELESLKERVTQESERSEEHTSELQSLMRISYAVFCLKKKNTSDYTYYNEQRRRK